MTDYELEDDDLIDDAIQDDELLDDEVVEEDDDQRVGAAPAWVISLAVHGLLILIMGLIVFGAMAEEEEPPIRAAIMDVPPPPEEEKEKIRTLEEVEVTVEDEVITENPVVTDLDIPVEELETEDPVEDEAVEPKGREEAKATAEAGGAAAFMAIGAGGGASGAFGSRTGGGKKRAVGRNGGSRASESAVNAALMWFKKHQSPNGQWDVDGYMDNCRENPKCEPGTIKNTDNGDGDCACTAYALLCFLGAGYDHKTPGKFKDTVKNGLEWLKGIQNPDGTFGVSKRNYENPICTMALCEAYAMTMDPSLKEPAQRAVNLLLERQAKSDKFPYGCGWDYTVANPKRNDSSVTGWCVMALKAAKSAGIDVGDGWEGAKQWFNAHWVASNPGKNPDSMGSEGKSYFSYTFNQLNEDVGFTFGSKNNFDMKKRRPVECVGALCAVFLGKRPGDGQLDSLIRTVMEEQVPKSYPTNTYWMYYNTLAVFQYGGADWKVWNDKVRDMLVDAQHGNGTGCFNGSWDNVGTGGAIESHIAPVGRLLSTAYCCLSLEVYYRYARVANKKK